MDENNLAVHYGCNRLMSYLELEDSCLIMGKPEWYQAIAAGILSEGKCFEYRQRERDSRLAGIAIGASVEYVKEHKLKNLTNHAKTILQNVDMHLDNATRMRPFITTKY